MNISLTHSAIRFSCRQCQLMIIFMGLVLSFHITLGQDCEEKDKRIADLTAGYEESETRVKERDQEIEKLRTKNNILQKENSDIRSKIVNLEKRLERTEEDLDKKKTSLNTMKEEKQSLQNLSTSLQKENKELVIRNKDQQVHINAQRSRIARLNDDLNRHKNTDVDSLLAKLGEAKEREKTLELNHKVLFDRHKAETAKALADAENTAQEALKKKDRTIADQKLTISRKDREMENARVRDLKRKAVLIKSAEYLINSQLYSEDEINSFQKILQDNKDVLASELKELNAQLESYRKLAQTLNKSRASLNAPFDQRKVNQNLKELQMLRSLSSIHQITKVELEYVLNKFCENQNKAKAYLQRTQGDDSQEIKKRILNDALKEIPIAYSYIRRQLNFAKEDPDKIKDINVKFKSCK